MMKPTPILALLAYGASVNAAVEPVCVGTLDTFEDITATPAADAVPVVSTAIGNYHGLDYSDFVIADEILTLVGVSPASGEKVAAASVATDLLFDKKVTAVPVGTINATTETGTFALQSFYFGCILDLHNSVADLAETCTIAVCGTRVDGVAVPCERFPFTVPAAGALAKRPLQLVQPSLAFVGVHSVTISVVDAPLGKVAQSQFAIILDDVCHLNLLA